MNRQPMNNQQRRILVFSLLIILLLAVLYFLFFGNGLPALTGAKPSPSPTFATVDEALKELPTPTPTPSPTPTISPPPTATPTPSPSPTPEVVVSLKKGSKGPEVVALQARLIELGYMKPGSNDGSYGSGTEAAVKAFQETNKLKADGIAGKDTQGRLYSEEAIEATK